MAFVYKKPFDGYFSPGCSNCVGYVDSSGYIYNEPYATGMGPGSSAFVGSIDADGYVYDCAYAGLGPGSSHCVGSVDLSDGYIYTCSYRGLSAGSSDCVGNVQGFGLEAKGGAAFLLLLGGLYSMPSHSISSCGSSSRSSYDDDDDDDAYSSDSGGSAFFDFYDAIDFLMDLLGIIGTGIMYLVCFALVLAILIAPFYLLFKAWGVF